MCAGCVQADRNALERQSRPYAFSSSTPPFFSTIGKRHPAAAEKQFSKAKIPALMATLERSKVPYNRV
jgi:hypothetical protein